MDKPVFPTKVERNVAIAEALGSGATKTEVIKDFHVHSDTIDKILDIPEIREVYEKIARKTTRKLLEKAPKAMENLGYAVDHFEDAFVNAEDAPMALKISQQANERILEAVGVLRGQQPQYITNILTQTNIQLPPIIVDFIKEFQSKLMVIPDE